MATNQVGILVGGLPIAAEPNINFASGNGIYLLDRNLNVSYKGSPVEAFNSLAITSATLIPNQWVVFTTTTGTALVSVACDGAGDVWANDAANRAYKIATSTMTKVGPTITVGQESSVSCYDSAHGGIWIPDELNALVYRILP